MTCLLLESGWTWWLNWCYLQFSHTHGGGMPHLQRKIGTMTLLQGIVGMIFSLRLCFSHVCISSWDSSLVWATSWVAELNEWVLWMVTLLIWVSLWNVLWKTLLWWYLGLTWWSRFYYLGTQLGSLIRSTQQSVNKTSMTYETHSGCQSSLWLQSAMVTFSLKVT